MRPALWHPPVDPSPAEQTIMRLVRRAKLFLWLRQHRHELFDEALQTELAAMYTNAPTGHPRYRPHSWPWPRSCRPTAAPPTMRHSNAW
jgi:hypothetical protein